MPSFVVKLFDTCEPETLKHFMDFDSATDAASDLIASGAAGRADIYETEEDQPDAALMSVRSGEGLLVLRHAAKYRPGIASGFQRRRGDLKRA